MPNWQDREREQRMFKMSSPNVIERLQEADAALTELRSIAGGILNIENYERIEPEISNVEGIIGEVLTMLDGR